MSGKINIRESLTVLTALLVCIVALLAGASLWLLRSMHNKVAHASATMAVLDHGRLITSRLADQPVVKNASADDPGWKQFSQLVNGLHCLENGLQYVSVTTNGVTVFHEQMTALDNAAPPVPEKSSLSLKDGQMSLSRRVLKVGGENVPVVAFNTSFHGDDGKPRTLEIALRKEAVGREEEAAADAISSMFKVSLATTLVSFGVCVLLVVWMMQREIRRETRRREQEHLIFAGVLANGIAHDFRNPMSSMKLDVQMLEKEISKGEKVSGEKLSKLTSRVLNTMNRMDKVFQEFLYLSKPGSDKTGRVQLAASIRDCVDMLAAGFDQTGVSIKQDIQDENLEVVADQTSIRRAILNVLTNALQFSRQGDTVSIRLTRSGNKALICISDQGPGIPVADRKKIFDIFVSSRAGGTGLGLFLARTAVERAGGSIEVVDAPGHGAQFNITIPLSLEDIGEIKNGKTANTGN